MSCPEQPFEGSVPTGELPRWLFEASVPQAFASAALAPKVKVLGGWALGVGVINPEDGASGMGLASPQITFTFHFHALEKEMATHSSILAWRIPGTGEPGGLPSMGSHRVGHD